MTTCHCPVCADLDAVRLPPSTFAPVPDIKPGDIVNVIDHTKYHDSGVRLLVSGVTPTYGGQSLTFWSDPDTPETTPPPQV